MASLQSSLSSKEGLRLVSISVDPEFDTQRFWRSTQPGIVPWKGVGSS
jgi:cytochrome oxidase Cu insertion factor (SCO1/SenC/PrrC family)